MKPIQKNGRIEIACNYLDRPKWQRVLAVPLIYIPIITWVPFAIVTVFIVRSYLVITGARNLKKYKDFLPEWISHRYTYDTQVTPAKYRITRPIAKILWVINCKLYCPFSVALSKYLTYLIQVVEIWWCPFTHSKKDTYNETIIDKSFWHLDEAHESLLDNDDKENSIWNSDFIKRQ